MKKIEVNLLVVLSAMGFFINSRAGVTSSKLSFDQVCPLDSDQFSEFDENNVVIDIECFEEKEYIKKCNEMLNKITYKLNNLISTDAMVMVSVTNYIEKGNLSNRFNPLIIQDVVGDLLHNSKYYRFEMPSIIENQNDYKNYLVYLINQRQKIYEDLEEIVITYLNDNTIFGWVK